MLSRFTRAVVSIAAVAALSVPAVALASNGSDDPPNHVRREHHRIAEDHHRHRGEHRRHVGEHHRRADDGVRTERRGAGDDGPNHR